MAGKLGKVQQGAGGDGIGGGAHIKSQSSRLPLMAAQTTALTPVGFELTQLALVELESTPLDHSGKVSLVL